MCTKSVSTKIIFMDRCALTLREPFIESFYIIYATSNTNKKITDIIKEKLNPLVEEYRIINSKPTQF